MGGDGGLVGTGEGIGDGKSVGTCEGLSVGIEHDSSLGTVRVLGGIYIGDGESVGTGHCVPGGSRI